MKFYNLEQLIFGHVMILPIKNNLDREITCQKNQVKIHKDNNR